MPSPDDLLMDRYRILERIGSGGMATVHRARDERLDRDVALKILLPNLADDPATAARFEHEARSLAASSHPGVVAVFDVDAGDPATGREPFFVMELCRGGSLADRLAGGRRMGPDDLIPILASVADGLADLHRRGIVHRDLKPQNILFGDDRPKLADFGLALSNDGGGPSELTTPGTAVGTLAYLGPEVLAGQRATAASDVYALGVVAFVGLTGAPPRPVGSLAELVAASGSAAPLVSSESPDLGRAFDAAVGSALALDPNQRPDALSFASGLASALGQWTRDGGPSRRSVVAAASAVPLPGPMPDDASLVAIARSPAWDPASAESATTASPTTASPFAEDATTVIPVDATGVYRAADQTSPGERRAGRWRPGRTAVAAALILIPTIAVLGLVGAALRSGPGAITGTPSASVSSIPASASPLASASAVASPSPSSPSPSADPAVEALNALTAAIDSARGGPDGLKGKEANDLLERVGKVKEALDRGDRQAALDAARELDKRIHDLGKRGEPLRDASTDLIRALGG